MRRKGLRGRTRGTSRPVRALDGGVGITESGRRGACDIARRSPVTAKYTAELSPREVDWRIVDATVAAGRMTAIDADAARRRTASWPCSTAARSTGSSRPRGCCRRCSGRPRRGRLLPAAGRGRALRGPARPLVVAEDGERRSTWPRRARQVRTDLRPWGRPSRAASTPTARASGRWPAAPPEPARQRRGRAARGRGARDAAFDMAANDHNPMEDPTAAPGREGERLTLVRLDDGRAARRSCRREPSGPPLRACGVLRVRRLLALHEGDGSWPHVTLTAMAAPRTVGRRCG